MNIINHFKKKSNQAILKYLLTYITLNAITVSLVAIMSNFNLDLSQLPNPLKTLILISMQPIILIASLKIQKVSYTELNIQKGKILTNLWYSLSGFFIYIVFNQILIQTKLIDILPGFGQQDNIIQEFLRSDIEILIVGIFACFIGPIVEEIIFRGYLYNKFKENYSILTSAILTSILFSSAHMEFQVFSAILILSLIIHYVYEKTHSLGGAITFHVINNTIMFILVLNL